MQEIILGQHFAAGDFYGVLDTYWAPVYPILIGIVSFFTDSPVVPATVVSLVAGSLSVPLAYLLVRESYGARAGLIAAVLAVFFPHLINSVFGLGSENIYIVFVLGVLIVAWRAMKRDSKLLFFGAGILVGLAYLTRPEAAGYPIFFIIFGILFNRANKRSFVRSSLPMAAAIILGFGIMATPYILYLHGQTGSWTISGKTKINTIVNELGENPQIVAPAPATFMQTAKELSVYFVLNLIDTQKRLPILLPPLLFLLIGLGLFRNAWSRDRMEREVYLISFCLITLAGYAAAVVQVRYFYALLPIFFGWMALGIILFSKWLNRSMRNWRLFATRTILSRNMITVLTLFVIFLYVLPLNIYMRSSASAWESQGYEERDAGVWLKRNSPPQPYIFSASRRPVFYAGGKQLTPVTTDPQQILADIKAKEVTYVVTSERSLKRNPFLSGFDEILRNDPYFEVVYDDAEKAGYRISIFKRR